MSGDQQQRRGFTGIRWMQNGEWQRIVSVKTDARARGRWACVESSPSIRRGIFRPDKTQGDVQQSQPNGYDRPDHRISPAAIVPIVPGTPARPPINVNGTSMGRRRTAEASFAVAHPCTKTTAIEPGSFGGIRRDFLLAMIPSTGLGPVVTRSQANPRTQPYSSSASERKKSTTAKQSQMPVPERRTGICISITCARGEVQDKPEARNQKSE
jgi:hypothetical protein